MPDSEMSAEIFAANKTGEYKKEAVGEKTLLDYFAIALSTFGVGFIPFAPGTWGSAIAVLIYLAFARVEAYFSGRFLQSGFTEAQLTAWIHVFYAAVFLLFTLAGIWAASRASRIFNDKDPGKVVVDEVIGQLIVYLFVPFGVSWTLVAAGFFLFRLFDIWKPYPIDSLQSLPTGLGVCADDILAGVYAGVCLALFYAVGLIV